MRCVPLKSHEQLALQATHRVRQRFIVERTATVNQMRALLLEYGLTVPVGRKVFERSLPTILEDAENGLPDFIRALVLRLRERWQQLDIQIDEMSLMLGQASSTSRFFISACKLSNVDFLSKYQINFLQKLCSY
jgi:transposase